MKPAIRKKIGDLMPETNDKEDQELLAERTKPAPIQLHESQLPKEAVQQGIIWDKINPPQVQHQKAPSIPDIQTKKDKSSQNQPIQAPPSNATSSTQKLSSSQSFSEIQESGFYRTTGIQRIKYVKPTTLIIAVAGFTAGTLAVSVSVQRIFNNELPVKKTEINVQAT
jgi:hypothetical protein